VNIHWQDEHRHSHRRRSRKCHREPERAPMGWKKMLVVWMALPFVATAAFAAHANMVNTEPLVLNLPEPPPKVVARSHTLATKDGVLIWDAGKLEGQVSLTDGDGQIISSAIKNGAATFSEVAEGEYTLSGDAFKCSIRVGSELEEGQLANPLSHTPAVISKDGTLTGRIFLPDMQTPAKEATVVLKVEGRNSYTTTTDEHGVFNVQDCVSCHGTLSLSHEHGMANVPIQMVEPLPLTGGYPHNACEFTTALAPIVDPSAVVYDSPIEYAGESIGMGGAMGSCGGAISCDMPSRNLGGYHCGSGGGFGGRRLLKFGAIGGIVALALNGDRKIVNMPDDEPPPASPYGL